MVIAKLITLTRDLETEVSPCDFDMLNQFKWYAHMSKWRKPYAARTKSGKPKKLIYMHRQIMDAPKGKVVDHINGDSLDNRRENLRICDYEDNAHNRDFPSGKVDYRGVRQRDGRFEAAIQKGGKKIYIGSYHTPEEAAIAYDVKARRMFGDHARVNFEDSQETVDD